MRHFLWFSNTVELCIIFSKTCYLCKSYQNHQKCLIWIFKPKLLSSMFQIFEFSRQNCQNYFLKLLLILGTKIMWKTSLEMLKNETFFVIFKHCGMISLCKSYQNHQNCLIWIFTPNFMNFCRFHQCFKYLNFRAKNCQNYFFKAAFELKIFESNKNHLSRNV